MKYVYVITDLKGNIISAERSDGKINTKEHDYTKYIYGLYNMSEDNRLNLIDTNDWSVINRDSNICCWGY